MVFRAVHRDKQIHVVALPDLMIRSDRAHAKMAPLSPFMLKPLQRVQFSFKTHYRACVALASATLIAGGGVDAAHEWPCAPWPCVPTCDG